MKNTGPKRVCLSVLIFLVPFLVGTRSLAQGSAPPAGSPPSAENTSADNPPSRVDGLLHKYLGTYVDEIRRADGKDKRKLIGIPLLEELASRPFVWPKPVPPTTVPKLAFPQPAVHS
jgi:hypothetical protein